MERSPRPPWLWACAIGAVLTGLLFPALMAGAEDTYLYTDGDGSAYLIPLLDLVAFVALAIASIVLAVVWLVRSRRPVRSEATDRPRAPRAT